MSDYDPIQEGFELTSGYLDGMEDLANHRYRIDIGSGPLMAFIKAARELSETRAALAKAKADIERARAVLGRQMEEAIEMKQFWLAQVLTEVGRELEALAFQPVPNEPAAEDK